MLHRIAFICTILILCATICSAQGPFREEFAGGRADAHWETHCSAGNSITVRDGVARISADLNSYAHLSRRLGLDNVTVSARIKPSIPAGVTWCTSVFLVWDGGNWCQMGMISQPAGGSGFYAVETVEGGTVETYLDPCDLEKWNYVRIQLGNDCIRYIASTDGRKWKVLRLIERPREFNGAPVTLCVGKGYGRGRDAYPAQDLDNDYSDRGPRVVSSIADIAVEETPAALLALTDSERRERAEIGLDPVGRIELARKGDVSYERISRYYPPMKYPKEAVGVPEHPVDICVDYLGRLQLNYNTPLIARLEIGDPPIPFGDEKTPITRKLLDGWIPAVILTTEHGGVRYELTVFGWSEGFSPDAPLFAYVRLRARGSKLPGKVTLVSDSTGRRTEFPMTGGESCISMPFPSADAPVPITSDEYGRTLKQYADSWRKVLAQGERIEVPEKRVNDAYKAWLAYSLLDVDKVNGYPEPRDGTGFYEEIYGYSAALYCIMLDMYGMHDQAERYLDTLLHFQQPDGLYTQNFGLPDTGGLLLALAEHYNYTDDKVWLQRVSDNIVRAGEWLIRRRNDAPKTGVTRGLIKFRAYCDYAEPVYDYYSDSYCAVGLAKAAVALDALGMTDQARKFGDEAVRYRADIMASMERAVIEKDGMKMLPLEPETHRLLKDSRYTGGDYYGLVASSMLENELIPADDRRAWWVTDLMEQRNGLIAGLCKFQSGGIDHAYTYGYLLTQLKRNDARKVILGFYGMLAYGMTRETYSGVECTGIVTGNNYWTLPHLYSNTQQLKLLRMMLLREDEDSLLIGDAIPRAWLEDGKVVQVEETPTRFGEVSFEIVSQSHSGLIEIRLTPPQLRPPDRVRIRLRHPDDLPIRSVTVNGRAHQRFARDYVEMPRLTGPVEVRVQY